jgi:N-acetylmuramoyl-L-alanine amidase
MLPRESRPIKFIQQKSTFRAIALKAVLGAGRFAALMRAVFMLWCVWALAGNLAAQKSDAPLRSISLNGRDYVGLQDWGQARKMDGGWTRKDDQWHLSARDQKFVFKVDSQRAEFNGVAVYLSHPVAARNGQAFVAQSDLDGLVIPLLSPTRNRPGQRVKTIALCPGHGGKDPGNQLRSHQEKKYTLLLAKEVQSLLVRSGFKVVLTRSGDKYVGLEERADLANRKAADLYVSLHYNCANPGNHETKGVEIYCLTPAGSPSTHGASVPDQGASAGNRNDSQNVLLAYQLQKAFVQQLRMEDRGVRRARFMVLRLATMPAVLVEAGFMSCPQEMTKIQDRAHRRRTAQAVVGGLLAYKRLVER